MLPSLLLSTLADALSEDYPTAHTVRPTATDKWPCGQWPLASLDTPLSGLASILGGSGAVPQPGLLSAEAHLLPLAALAA